MIISVDKEKILENILQNIYIFLRTLSKLSKLVIEENSLNLMKGIYQKTIQLTSYLVSKNWMFSC